jgi:hypothetical protein
MQAGQPRRMVNHAGWRNMQAGLVNHAGWLTIMLAGKPSSWITMQAS